MKSQESQLSFCDLQKRPGHGQVGANLQSSKGLSLIEPPGGAKDDETRAGGC